MSKCNKCNIDTEILYVHFGKNLCQECSEETTESEEEKKFAFNVYTEEHGKKKIIGKINGSTQANAMQVYGKLAHKLGFFIYRYDHYENEKGKGIYYINVR